MERAGAAAEAVTEQVLRGWPLPEPGSDKGERGQVLVVGGSAQTPGAVLLAGEAALRAGAGKLQVATAAAAAVAVAVAAPESLVRGLPQDDRGLLTPAAGREVLDAVDDGSVVLFGPGLVDPGSALAFGEAVLPHLDAALVLDALGTCYLTEHPEGLAHLAGRCVVTVNPTELSRVLGVGPDDIGDDLGTAAGDLAQRTGAVVLCGGTVKITAAPDGRLWRDEVGGPGLGVSGSGDVQAGLVTGLLARGASPEQAAVWGAHLHGAAGDRLAERVGLVGYLARDLPSVVPGLLAQLDR